jgi:hypothetical protein
MTITIHAQGAERKPYKPFVSDSRRAHGSNFSKWTTHRLRPSARKALCVGLTILAPSWSLGITDAV